VEGGVLLVVVRSPSSLLRGSSGLDESLKFEDEPMVVLSIG